LAEIDYKAFGYGNFLHVLRPFLRFPYRIFAGLIVSWLGVCLCIYIGRDVYHHLCIESLNLEEAKVQIANRYQAQVALNQAAMTAADRIHELQKGASDEPEAQELFDRIREASAAMQTTSDAPLRHRIGEEQRAVLHARLLALGSLAWPNV
jgi:hypothetical protein